MIEIARRWRVVVGGVAAGAAAVLGFAGTVASADPVFPLPTPPVPATVTQTVTVMPNAAALVPQALGQQTVPQALGQPAVPQALGQPALPQAVGQPAVPQAVDQPAALAATPAVPAPPPVTITPASSGTLADFFKAKGVKLEPQASRDFKALNIVLPMPKGWAQVPDPNVPDAFAVIADRVGGNGLYSSNAQLIVYRLIGDFDPKEAISHGFIDSQQLPAWRTTDASLADFAGMPSSVIEGTYRENSMTLNTSRRHVIVTAGPNRYLVSLYVTTSVDEVVATADATDAIVNGFQISVPGQAPPAPPAPAPPPGPPQPPVAPQLPGRPG